MQKFQPCKSEFAYLALCSTDIFFIENSQLSSILTKGHDKSLFVLYDLAFSHMYQLHVHFSVIDESSTTSLFLFFFLNTHLSTVTLKRIDLTGNLISEIEDGAFSKLTLLEELSLAENQLVKLPALPAKLTSFNANYNKLKTKGVKANAFKVHHDLYEQTTNSGD